MVIYYRIRRVITGVYSEFLRAISPLVIERWHEGFWCYRKYLIDKEMPIGGGRSRQLIYRHYLNRFGAFVGLNTEIASPPFLPHNLHGIFISEGAKIGKNVTIFQHVTIGGNHLKDSKRRGAPIIEDGVLIGAGAKIIGSVTIGRNSRIGAGCVVAQDVPPNRVVVMPKPLIIEKNEELNNEMVLQVNTLLKV